MQTKIVQTRVTTKTHKVLTKLAADDGRSLISLLNKVLTEYAASQTKK